MAAPAEPPGEPGTQERAVRFLEAVPADEVREAARRHPEYREATALALGRIDRALILAEEANDGAAIDALLALGARERAGGA